MSVAKFSVGRSGAGGANAEYITREKAAEKIAFHNLEKLEAKTREEARTNAIAYAHTREDAELAKSKKGRTHYRLLLTWDRKESSEKVVEEAQIYLQKTFPKARAIIAAHQDTDHSHAHVWIDARQTDDKKVHIGKEYLTLDEVWTKQFDQAYGTTYAAEYRGKKQRIKGWKRSTKHWKDVYARDGNGDKNRPLPAKPQRAADIFDVQYWRDKEIENIGVNNKTDEKIRLGTDQSDPQIRNRPVEGAKQLDPRTEPVTLRSESTSRSATAANLRRTQSGERRYVLAPPDSRTDFGEGQRNKSEFDKSHGKYSSDALLHDVHNEDNQKTSNEPDREKDFAEQFYQRRLREFSTDRNGSLGELSGKLDEISNFGTTNVETFAIPQITISEPQFNPNTEAFIKDITEMMRTNLANQNKQMSLQMETMYQNKLEAAATVPPSQMHIDYVTKFNDAQESEDKKINLEGKSKLETIHAVLSNADEDERRNLLDQGAEVLDKKIAEKQEAKVQEMEFSRGWSM